MLVSTKPTVREVRSYNTPNKISVWREDVWEGAALGIGRRQFNPCAPLNVIFYNPTLGEETRGEGAVDRPGGSNKVIANTMHKGHAGASLLLW